MSQGYTTNCVVDEHTDWVIRVHGIFGAYLVVLPHFHKSLPDFLKIKQIQHGLLHASDLRLFWISLAERFTNIYHFMFFFLFKIQQK